MAERAYPEDPGFCDKSKYYDAFIDRYKFGEKYTKDNVVLDIPCGSGWGTSLIVNAREVYGIDVSSEAIQYARKNFKGNFLQGSMCSICFKDDTFDVALCFEGIEHITKDEGRIFLNEIKRVVKKNGLIVGSVPILDWMGRNSGNPYHKFEYPEKYLKMLLRNNFRVCKYRKKRIVGNNVVFFVLKNEYKCD